MVVSHGAAAAEAGHQRDEQAQRGHDVRHEHPRDARHGDVVATRTKAHAHNAQYQVQALQLRGKSGREKHASQDRQSQNAAHARTRQP